MRYPPLSKLCPVRYNILMSTPRIILIGSSYSAFAVYSYLQKYLLRIREPHDLLFIIDKSSCYNPSLLPEYLMDNCQINDVVDDVRKIAYTNPGIHILKTDLIDINFEEQKVKTSSGVYNYKCLVLAPDCDQASLDFDVSGENFFLLNNPTNIDFLKKHIINLLEKSLYETNQENRKNLLSFTVIGANYFGLETACSLYDFIELTMKREYPELNLDYKNFHLIERNKTLDLTDNIAFKNPIFIALNKRGIKLSLNNVVSRVDGDKIIFDDNKIIDSSTIVYANKSDKSSQLANILDSNMLNNFQIDLSGKIPKYKNVFLVGEMAKYLDLPNNLDSNSFIFNEQAKLCAENVIAAINSDELKPIHMNLNPGILTLGRFNACVRFLNYNFTGVVGWVVYRLIVLFSSFGLHKKARSMISLLCTIFQLSSPNFLNRDNFKSTSESIIPSKEGLRSS